MALSLWTSLRCGALLAASLAAGSAYAQTTLWSDVAEASIRLAGPRVTIPDAYRVVRLDLAGMTAQLATSPAERGPGEAQGETRIALPLPEGGFVEVLVVESSVMAPELQARFPEIRTYLAHGPGAVHGRLSRTPHGFHGMLFTPEGMVYIDPYARGDVDHYIVYRGSELRVDPATRGRIADEVIGEALPPLPRGAARAHGETLRTYRLAMAATGEYTIYHGGTVALGMAAIVTTMNRVTGLYERDLSVRFELISNNDAIVYTNPATDPYTNNSGTTMLGQNQTNLTQVIGNANYDVGHVFSTGGGGVATLRSVCSSTSKARGVTGSSQPVGDAFDVDYVAHEIGHQFGANHTFNGNASACAGGNRNAATAYEPGSGSTIMAYAGICGAQDLQPNSDALFHAASLDEVTAFITQGGGSTCGTAVATGNPIPTVSVPAAVTIPVGTPFTLTGSAIDDTPGALTYAWEEMDLGPAGAPGSLTPPLFRAFLPSSSPSRTFPQYGRLIAGQAPVIGERLPTDARVLTFRLTVRDNTPGAGAINDATTIVTTSAAAGPFRVTFAATAGQSFDGTATVTWDVAGTNAGAVNTPTVDILYSTNNGASFDHILASATPNDGSELVSFPVSTTQGRILVRAVGNVFFNVNPQPFSATAAQQTVAGAAGWRLLAPAATGLTVDNLAAINLVQGVPGYYPAASPNLLTGYDGTSFVSAGAGTPLVPGQGFFWYFYNADLTPGGSSNSYALPTVLGSPNLPVTTDTPVVLHGNGTRFNLLGNPFGTSLNLSEMATWPGADALQSGVAQFWTSTGPDVGTYETSITRPVIAPWQGFWVEAAPDAGTLTIPAAARTTGGVLQRSGGPGGADVVVALELSEADGLRSDRAAVLVLGEAFTDGPDAGDASKLAPFGSGYVLVGFGEETSLRAVESRPLAPVTLPLAVASVGASPDLVLRWPRLEGLPDLWTVRLTDLETGQVVDLRDADRYLFQVAVTPSDSTLVPGDVLPQAFPARFSLEVGPRGTVGRDDGPLSVLALDPVQPNPTSGVSTVRFALPTPQSVRLSVVDLLGREVAVLLDGYEAAGRHTMELDSSRLALGIYTVRLHAGGTVLTQRVTVVR